MEFHKFQKCHENYLYKPHFVIKQPLQILEHKIFLCTLLKKDHLQHQLKQRSKMLKEHID